MLKDDKKIWGGKMKRILMLLMISLVLFPMVSAFSVSPQSKIVDWTLGSDTQKTISFNITNPTNQSVNISVTKNGDKTDWLILPVVSVIPADSSISYEVTVENVDEKGTFIDHLIFGTEEVPVIIVVNEQVQNESGVCRIYATPDSYTTSILQDSPPTTQRFSIMVGKHCDGGVDLKTPIITGTTQTDEGIKPAYLIGGTNLGFKQPQEEGSFSIQFDVKGLPSGSYIPQILVYGYHNGDKVSVTIPLTVMVRGEATPVEGDYNLPTYSLSSTDLTLNKSYTISTNNLNPNFIPTVEPNPYLYGEKVEVSKNTWTYTFKPIKLGNTIIRVYTYYKGAPLGEVFEKEVRVMTGSGFVSGTKLKLEFYPRKITQGNVNILVRDNKTNNILPNAIIFVNGQKLNGNNITVLAGHTYDIAATKEGYLSVEQVITTPNQTISLSVSKSRCEVGDTIKISTTPSNTMLKLDSGESINPSWAPTKAGNYTIVATKNGFQKATTNVIVEPALKVISNIPEKIVLKNKVLISLNKPAEWKVTFTPTKEEIPITYAQSPPGGSENITFIPTKKGIYTVLLRNGQIASYDIRGLHIPTSWIWVIVIIVIIIFLLLRKSGGSSGGYPSFSGQEVVSKI